MDFFDVIRARRSIRRFRPDPVPDALITPCLEAARLAPSGTNAQPWKFLVIRDPGLRAGLCQAAYNQPFVGEAPVVIVVLGDRKAYKLRLRRGKELIDRGAVDPKVIEKIGAIYRERGKAPGEEERSILLNCMLAAEHLVLAATAMGLGSCWVRLFKEEEVASLCALPEYLFPVALLPLGYPAESPDPRPRYSLAEIAWRDHIHQAWTEEASSLSG